MRLFVLLIVASIAELTFAGDGIFGTKTSPAPRMNTESPIGVMPVLQMLVALAIVLAIVKWVLPLMLKKTGNRFQSGGSGIKVEETASIGGANLAVVSVRGRTLLIGTTAQNVTLLSNLSDFDESPLPITFHEMLEQEAATDMKPDLTQQLDRLRNLGF